MSTPAPASLTEYHARRKTESLTLEELVDAFAATETDDDESIPTVRGWLMDELERRNPAAFGAWLDSAEASAEDLRRLFEVS